MTKAKKVLSLVLAVVMVAATFAFSASAATQQNATFTVSVDNATVSKGDVITVTVNLTTDYYAGPTNVPVYYNPKVFEFVEKSVTGAKIFGETGTDMQSHNDAVTGCLKVAFIPDTADSTAAAKVMNGENLFTFKLRAIADGPSNIGLKPGDQKTSSNIGGTLYCGAYKSSAITANPDTVGQTFTIKNTTATVGAAEPNTLVVKDTFANASSVIIDKYAPNFFKGDTDTTGVVYGIETLGFSNGFETYYALADALTTTLGDEYLRITASNAEEGYESTGTLIEVLDTDKTTVLETYYFVYFGDVNGDGYVDNGDASAAESYALESGYLTTIYEVLGGDANGDTYTDNGDSSMIETAALGQGDFSVQEDVAVLFWEAISPEYGI